MGKKWLSLVATVFAASCLAGTECTRADCRESFEASFYLGMSIDGFAAGEVRRYLNPGAADVLQERGLAGISFAYRLLGAPNNTPASVDAGHPTPEEEKTMARTGKAGQLWVYGETTHGTRSMDLNCGARLGTAACASQPQIPGAPFENSLFILRNATSLEAFMGVRYEFLTLQTGAKTPTSLYLKAQAGFATVTNSGDSAKDIHHIGIGALATKGDFEGSYLEAGLGRTDLFADKKRWRAKLDGYLSRKLNGTVSIFARFMVDTDLGPHADSFQTYIGFNFNLRRFDVSNAAQR
jgi:hypothetical protein